jgi:hypothetical protein
MASEGISVHRLSDNSAVTCSRHDVATKAGAPELLYYISNTYILNFETMYFLIPPYLERSVDPLGQAVSQWDQTEQVRQFIAVVSQVSQALQSYQAF